MPLRPFSPRFQVPKHRLAEIRRFFEDYKKNEDKVVTVGEFYGVEKARDTIMKAARSPCTLACLFRSHIVVAWPRAHILQGTGAHPDLTPHAIAGTSL